MRAVPSSPRFKFFQFHAVVWEILAKSYVGVPLEGWPEIEYTTADDLKLSMQIKKKIWLIIMLIISLIRILVT